MLAALPLLTRPAFDSLLRKVDERPPPDDESPEERRLRLERIGREEAARASSMDTAADDGGLMAEFNARLDSEGGKDLFKLKTGVTGVADSGKEAAQKAQYAVSDALDSVPKPQLNEQQLNIAKIIGGLILFNVVINAIAGGMGGGGGGGDPNYTAMLGSQ